MACDSAPKKLPYHTPSVARIIGRFEAKGWLRKARSISCAPVRNSTKFSQPMASAIEVPMADHEEYRPPTQSQKPNMLAVSMPKSATALAFVESAAKWLPTALANYELRPQIALGILTVAGFVLLRLVNDESSTIQSLQHCRPLFRSLRAWVNSGHRQLRSLAHACAPGGKGGAHAHARLLERGVRPPHGQPPQQRAHRRETAGSAEASPPRAECAEGAQPATPTGRYIRRCGR